MCCSACILVRPLLAHSNQQVRVKFNKFDMYTVFFCQISSGPISPQTIPRRFSRRRDRPHYSFLHSIPFYLPWFLIANENAEERLNRASTPFNPLHLVEGSSRSSLHTKLRWSLATDIEEWVLSIILSNKWAVRKGLIASKLVSFRRRFRKKWSSSNPVPFDSYARAKSVIHESLTVTLVRFNEARYVKVDRSGKGRGTRERHREHRWWTGSSPERTNTPGTRSTEKEPLPILIVSHGWTNASSDGSARKNSPR